MHYHSIQFFLPSHNKYFLTRSIQDISVFNWPRQTRWPNDKTIIVLGCRRISWFVSVSQINYLPNSNCETLTNPIIVNYLAQMICVLLMVILIVHFMATKYEFLRSLCAFVWFSNQIGITSLSLVNYCIARRFFNEFIPGKAPGKSENDARFIRDNTARCLEWDAYNSR